LFTYDAVCGEKETGTLRLVLSNSVPKHLILIGKVVGNSITLFVPLLLTALVVLVMIVLSPEISLNSEEISKAVLIIYVFLVYLLGFFFLGILISTTTQQTRVALLLLLLLWISSISVIPPMSFTAVERSIPIPSWFESQTRINANLRNMDKAVMDDIMKMVHTSAKPVDMEKFSDEVNAIRKSARERALRENAKIQEDFEQREKRQIEVAMDISRISPAAALSNAATALAGNDFYSHYLFKKSLRAYKERFLAFLEKQGVLARQVADPEELLGRRLDLTTLPAYRFTGESLSETIQRIFPDLILLHGFPILLFTISYLVFIKYDVR
jgi:ABC-2 type transport system permease protein